MMNQASGVFLLEDVLISDFSKEFLTEYSNVIYIKN